jgi:hypothetical protein
MPTTGSAFADLSRQMAEQAGWDPNVLVEALMECQTDMILLRQQMAAIQQALDDCRSDWGPGDYAYHSIGDVRTGAVPSPPALQAIFGRTSRGSRRRR